MTIAMMMSLSNGTKAFKKARPKKHKLKKVNVHYLASIKMVGLVCSSG